MKHIGSYVGKRTPQKGITERGEMMRYFCERLNASRLIDGLKPISMARMGKILEAIPTKDLYYLRSVCDKATNFSKKFWWEINPKKHLAPRPRAHTTS